MAELTLSASDIAAAITKGLDGYKPSTDRTHRWSRDRSG